MSSFIHLATGFNCLETSRHISVRLVKKEFRFILPSLVPTYHHRIPIAEPFMTDHPTLLPKRFPDKGRELA